MSASRFLPAGYVGKHDARTNDLLEGEPSVSNSLRDNFETALGLTVHIARRCDSSIRRNGSGAGDCQERTGSHCPREADNRLQRRAGGYELAIDCHFVVAAG